MEEEWPPYTIALIFKDKQVELRAVQQLTSEYCLITTEHSFLRSKMEDWDKPIKLYDLVFEFSNIEMRKGRKVHIYQFSGVREHAEDC